MGLRPGSAWSSAAVVLVIVVVSGGCAARPDRELLAQTSAGEYGAARVRALESLDRGGPANARALALLRYGVSALADGYPRSARPALVELFRLLRTQGLNEDKTLPAVVLNEDLKEWKGEPFEQAMAYHYVSLMSAMLGEWGNARAAAGESLFLLKNFGERYGGASGRVALAERAARAEAAGDADFLDTGYQPVRTDFALGYLMHAAASRSLGRTDEARDNLNRAVEANPALAPVANALLGGANTVFVVDYGAAPEKIAAGPAGSVEAFAVRTPSDRRGLSVRAGAGAAASWPVAADVNRMAADHRWNDLADVRAAKAVLGRTMTTAGAVVAAGADTETELYAGLGILLGGLFLEGGAHADTRHAEVLPQRVYVAPVRIEEPGTVVELMVEGDPGSRLVLNPVDPPTGGEELAVYHVRLVSGRGAPPAWAASGAVRYQNPGYGGSVPGDELPWILGGRDVSPPTGASLRRYQSAGRLRGYTTAELEELYRAEGLVWELEELGGAARRHVLEGGRMLIAPVIGSAGYARLFGREHPPYRPVSRLVREAIEDLGPTGAGAPVGSAE